MRKFNGIIGEYSALFIAGLSELVSFHLKGSKHDKMVFHFNKKGLS